MDVLKRRLREKISGLQSDAEAIKARLDDEERIRSSLKQCEERLQTKLEEAFAHLFELIEQSKQELGGKVGEVFSRQNEILAKQNRALHECMASVDKACVAAEELLKEEDRSTFLAAHNKISQHLEERFVELLMLSESDSCNISQSNVQSLETTIRAFCLADYFPPSESGKKVDDTEHCESNSNLIFHGSSPPLTPTTCSIVQITLSETVPTSVHTPFLFTSPPSSVPALTPSTSNLFCTLMTSASTSVSSPSFINCTANTSFSCTQLSVSSAAIHPGTISSTLDKTTTVSSLVSLPNTFSASHVVSVAPVILQSSSEPSLSTSPSSVVPVSTAKDIKVTSIHKSSKLTSTLQKDSDLLKTLSLDLTSTTSSQPAIIVASASKKLKTVTSTTSIIALDSKYRSVNRAKISHLCDLKQGDVMECIVTEVVSPSDFWIQPTGYELISLMNNMEYYYTRLEKDGNLGGLEELPKVGDYCCARFSQDSRWYRARVLSVDVHDLSHRIEVLYVDYGNQEEVPLSALCSLDYRFVLLPCQAVKCSLKVRAFVEVLRPELSGPRVPQWPQYAKTWFRSLLTGKHVTVKFLTASTSNHAQVDIAVTRETFLSSLSNLHGVLTVADAIKQFLWSAQISPLFTLFGVSNFMCAVKLANFVDDNVLGTSALTDHSFCGSSIFNLPAPGPIFMHPFSGMPMRYSMFPIVKYCNPPSSPAIFPSGFIQPFVSPTSSLKMLEEASPVKEQRSYSEKLLNTKKTLLKKRSSSLTEVGDLSLPVPSVDLPFYATVCGENIAQLSGPKLDQISPKSESVVDVTSLQASMSDLPDTPTGLHQSISLSSSPPVALSSKCSSTPNSSVSFESHSHSLTTVSALTPSVSFSPSPLSGNESVVSLQTSLKSSSPLSTVAAASKSSEHTSRALSAASKDDVIRFHTIAALPILSSVIFNDSNHYSIIVSHVVSPSEFYLNFASDVEEVKNFDSFQQSLHDHYSTDEETQEDLSASLTIGVLCCAKYTDGTWNRGIIRDIQAKPSEDGDEAKSKYLVQYVDYGNYQWTSVKNIQPLHEDYLSQPALTIRCTMSEVVPSYDRRRQRRTIKLSSKVVMTAAGSEDDFQEWYQDSEELLVQDKDVFESASESKGLVKEWSCEATNTFMQLTSDKVLVAMLSKEVMMLSWDDVLEVDLIDTNGTTDLYIAEELVSKGLARYKTDKLVTKTDKLSNDVDSSESMSSSAIINTSISKKGDVNPLSPTEAALNAWNPMESHFLSNLNLYADNMVDRIPAGGRGSGALRTRRDKQDAATKDPAMVSKSWKMQTVSLPSENTCVPIVITAVYSPIKFWVQLLLPADLSHDEENDRNEYEVTLSQLCEEMNKQYSRSVFKERGSEMIAHGEMVAAISLDDQCWYRAVLKDFDDNSSSVLVAFVDYGDTAWIPEANIRRLHPKFFHLPIQAVECTLDGLKLNEDADINWAIQEFLEIVKDKAFAAHVIERDTLSNRLSLELYDSNTSGVSDNLKSKLLSKEIAVRTITAIKNSAVPAVVGHKKNSSSLPG